MWSNHDRDKGASGGRVTSLAMSSTPTSTASLHGWGRTAPTLAHVTVPRTAGDVAAAVTAPGPRGVIARGLGRSYGDPAQNAGGLVLDMTGLARPPAIDADTGVAVVDAGVSLDTLMRAALPLGLWVPVLPGTRQVTIGGAIGADVHGKNHHTKGSFGNHVLSMDLVTADGAVRTLTPDGPEAELFWATVGGMGLTGVIVSATVQLHRTESAYFVVDTDRTRDLDELMALLTDGSDDTYGYSAAWFDTTTTGAKLGRAVLTRGSLATRDQLPAKLRERPAEVRGPAAADVPRRLPERPGQPGDAAGVQRALVPQGAAPPARRDPEHHGLLPGARPVRRLEPGLRLARVPAVPVPRPVRGGAGAAPDRRADRGVAARVRAERAQAVRRGQPGTAVVPPAGLDDHRRLPDRRRGLHRFCDELDELVLEAGGRLYLAKESRTTGATFKRRLPPVRGVAQGPRRRRPRRRLRLRHGPTTGADRR